MNIFRPASVYAFLALGLCAVPLAAGGADPASAGTNLDDRVSAAVRKGLEWLKENQKANGSWSDENYPAITGFGLWVFAQSAHPARVEVGDKAARFIAGFVQDDGGIYKRPSGLFRRGGLATYNTAICMTALHAYDRGAYQTPILNARKFVASCQLTGDSPDVGGFGYGLPGQGRGRGDLSNTAWSLQAMRLTQGMEDLRPAGQRAEVNWAAAVEYATKLQNNDPNDPANKGGFGYDRSGSRGGTVEDRDRIVKLRGYGSMTYAGLLSMIYAGVDRTDPRVVSALDWVSRHWTLKENPGMGTRGLFYYYNILTKSLSLTGKDTVASSAGDPIPWKKQVQEHLLSIQKPDGSWVNSDNTFWEGNPVIVTSYAVLTLQYTMAVPTPAK